MKTIWHFPVLVFMPVMLFAGQNFNAGWKFTRGSQPGAEAVSFDDASWTPVRLPHDWAISGPYEPEGNGHTGKLPWRGEGWYRNTFSFPGGDAGKRVYLDFDGVMAIPVVYVNGREAGRWDYGYMSFRVDATDFVRFGESNVVAVHVDTRQHESRWYPGAGIYRNVHLVISDPVSISHWGTVVTTPSITTAAATVRVRTTVENHRDRPAAVKLESVLIDPSGRQIGKQPVSSTVTEKGT